MRGPSLPEKKSIKEKGKEKIKYIRPYLVLPSVLGGAEMLTSDGVSTVMYASALTDPLPDPELPVSSSRII